MCNVTPTRLMQVPLKTYKKLWSNSQEYVEENSIAIVNATNDIIIQETNER